MLELCRRCKKRIEGLSIEITEVNEVEEEECVYCCGLFLRLSNVAEKIAEELNKYEINSIQVGCLIKGSVKEFENYFFGEAGKIKHEINYELSNRLCKLLGAEDVRKSGKIADVVVNVDAEDLSYKLRITPIYIYGRYIKRVRGIPQTRWMCSACNGRGCQVCGFTGKRYPTSIEEMISEPCLKLTEGEEAILHGAGREDIDARMLGNGRPFIIEIRKPKIRSVNLKELEDAVNRSTGGKLSVKFLGFAEPKHVSKLKTANYRKKYRAIVEFEKNVSRDELEKALEELSYTVVNQFTPKRVEHRRANVLRRRNTYKLELILLREKKAVITVEADSGLYIKELISGDNGRTKPSLSEILNNPSRVVRLDVLGVLGGLNCFENVNGG